MAWPEYEGRAYEGTKYRSPGYEGLDELIRTLVRRYVKGGEEEKREWEKEVKEGDDPLRVASLLLRSLPNVKRMGFEGFELVDPEVRSSG